jgi:hypothetical protein
LHAGIVNRFVLVKNKNLDFFTKRTLTPMVGVSKDMAFVYIINYENKINN